MAKMNYAALNRKPVQRDGAYSDRSNITPRTRKMAKGWWAKWDGEWVIAVADGHSLPEDKVIEVKKSNGDKKLVRLLNIVGNKQLSHVKMLYYSFAQVDGSLPSKT